jgi:hypothetical protein
MNTETTAKFSRQFSWLAATLLGLLIIQITGCANVPEGSPAMQQQALSFSPPPGKAGLYVIRPNRYAGSILLDEITFDYQECGSLAPDTYLFGTIAPGQHLLKADNPNLGSYIHFTAEAGKNYYFTISVKSAIVLLESRYQMELDQVSETDGQKYVRQLKLSGDNRFEYQDSSGQTP